LLKQKERRFGTEFLNDGKVSFNFWAPDAQKIMLCIKQNDDTYLELPMKNEEEGWFSLRTDKAKTGSQYMFKLENGLMVPDPASRCQAEDVHGPSVVVDPSAFDWENDVNWKGRPWNETVLYEIHTGTFTPEGTFKAIKEKLDYFVSLGVTAIELMPVSDFPGKRNWGYDGVLHFAPDRSYGSPEDLKDLIKAAHDKGLMVFIDVVYNHFGPDGNYLYCYAKSKFFEHKHVTPWGDAINFENQHVRNFFVQNTIYWLEEYRFDGIRFDAVHEIKDDSSEHILYEIAKRTRELIKDRKIHLVLENDNNIASFLTRKDNDPRYYEAQWNDDFHHAAHIHLTSETGGYYGDYTPELSGKTPTYFLARCLAEGFAYQGEISAYRENTSRGEKSTHLNVSSFVNFIQNHDQVGNRAFGERLASLTSKEALKAAACLYLMSPNIPLLFMGEEWACKTPFMFFCNFGEDLADSVREGRRKEFSRFPEFADPANRENIPDPTIAQTYENSKLDWNVQDKDVLDFYSEMLKLRHNIIMPLIPLIDHSKSISEIIEEGCLRVRWFADNGRTLELIANMSYKTINYDVETRENVIAKYATGEKPEEIAPWSVYWYLKD